MSVPGRVAAGDGLRTGGPLRTSTVAGAVSPRLPATSISASCSVWRPSGTVRVSSTTSVDPLFGHGIVESYGSLHPIPTRLTSAPSTSSAADFRPPPRSL